MAIFKNLKAQQRELGFGSKNYNQRVRFINDDGSVNVSRTGLGMIENIDIYHWLIRASGFKLSLVILSSYIFINLIFACIYFSIGYQNFGGLDGATAAQKFLNLFFFSAQTVTTLGYGHIYPIGNAASIAASFESLIGLLSFAIATGILFGRFSRPKADILYSKNILIAPYEGITGLMFRISNKKQYELLETEASVTMTMNNPETKKRDFFNLNLEINRINYLALSWTIVHPINEESPLFGLLLKDLEERDVEIIILMKGINDTFSQTVHSRFSYKANEFVVGAKFKPLQPEATNKGKLKISVNHIHHYDMVN